MHIILIEDDLQLGDAIRRALERLTYTISWFRDGREALIALREHDADLVLLDLGLPGKDGLDVLTEARRVSVTTPVIVMSARDAIDSRIRVLDAGADDYLVKPFHLDELAARIRSLTRRVRGAAVNRLEAGALSLDLGTYDCLWHGQRVELTRREFSLLQVLMERAGRIVRRESLETSLYGPDSAMSTSALEVLVHSLRRKLSHGAIQTVRGFGYMVPREPQ
ncbi:DNA-binding response regulator, OmpR family, contains REC and winged-helix (wHTH) domain [Luteibacter sp. UNCMF331Sha3.1]|uniref:response regulator n=1 Tax=Luteibacter sp. UNCMF331Sha3.1 TaxID=1502760 RepID=UPI0008BBB1C2|nr:response regulator [Luteibacter sp. UNCMF331Sha3.1]SEM89794.1 DNA-binding response regulator, OmpR family, contains REC and winged-helix (wHTH) domain [Luteibacter sp. UNCMF331Sha3.1]